MILKLKRICVMGLIGLGAIPALAESDALPPRVVELPLHAAVATQPSALLPNVTEQQPGNAAQLYLMSALSGPSQAVFDKLEGQYGNMPLDELAKADLGKLLEPFGRQLQLVSDAARRDHVEWDTQLRQRGELAVLPHLNHMRAFANLLSLKSRWQIARHDWVAARYTLQTGFAMCEQLNDHPVLIQGLVQCGLLDVLFERIEEWLAQPDAPNLYWALSDFPQPLADLRAIKQWEQGMLQFTFPQLDPQRPNDVPAKQWPMILSQFGKLAQMHGGESLTAEEVAMQVAVQFPEAEKALLGVGYSSDSVKAMSINQVVGSYWLSQYILVSTEAWRTWQLPYWQGMGRLPLGSAEEFNRRHDRMTENPFLTLVAWTGGARWQFARVEQCLAALRIIEAVRDYAGRHQKQLPATLADITDLPVPTDPVTGNAFTYRVEGSTATLELIANTQSPALAKVFHITLTH